MDKPQNSGRKEPESDADGRLIESKSDLPVEEREPGGSNEGPSDLLYTIDQAPQWYLCILLGFQHYLTMFGSTLTVPIVLAPSLCMAGDHLGLSELVSTTFFVSGICTMLQTTIGNRLPLVQGATFAFLTPSISILSQPRWSCPFDSDLADVLASNVTRPEVGGPEHRQMWTDRLRELQGVIMVASLFQVAIGFSGIMGVMLRFVGPLTVAPTVTLVGLALFGAATQKASKHWWIAFMTIVLIAVFSQYLRNVSIPYPRINRCKSDTNRSKGGFPIFKLFPVILAMVLSWFVCFILTVTNALPSNPNEWGFEARTDNRTYVIREAAWFRFPYPGQWGTPTISTSGVFGMLAGVLASMLESVGDYYACARLSGAPPPPIHAVNRGIGVEGIGCILAGAWGTGNGTTSYSENVGAIGITKVGSRRVVQWGAVLMLLLGCLGKFGALFVTIPEPVMGGVFMVMFGMITAVGLSNLQFVDLNSSRNLFVLGFAIFLGLSLPQWLGGHPEAIKTGSDIADQILRVLLSTSMFVGGLTGFILDNTVPGTYSERGLDKWRLLASGNLGAMEKSLKYRVYDIPIIQKYQDKIAWLRYLPFCPTFGIKTTREYKPENGEVGLDEKLTSTV